MITRDESKFMKNLLCKEYKVNEDEYFRLESKGVIDKELWDLYDLFINKELNGLFKYNYTLHRFVFDFGYVKLLKNANEDGRFGDYNQFDFDHFLTVMFDDDDCRLSCKDTVTGVMNFPYIDWVGVCEWISKAPIEWSVYIINPRLIHYNFGAIGLFLTPLYSGGKFIRLFNNYCVKLTGYPLFLVYSNEPEVPKICPIELNLTKQDFIKDLMDDNDNKGLLKLLEFWYENDCVRSNELEECYADFCDVQPYLRWDSMNYIHLSATQPFRLVHTETGEVLGDFKEFCLDKHFSVIDTDDGEYFINSIQVEDLMNGFYEFELC